MAEPDYFSASYQIEPGDVLFAVGKGVRNARVYRVIGVHLGDVNTESYVEVGCLTHESPFGLGKMTMPLAAAERLELLKQVRP